MCIVLSVLSYSQSCSFSSWMGVALLFAYTPQPLKLYLLLILAPNWYFDSVWSGSDYRVQMNLPRCVCSREYYAAILCHRWRFRDEPTTHRQSVGVKTGHVRPLDITRGLARRMAPPAKIAYVGICPFIGHGHRVWHNNGRNRCDWQSLCLVVQA